LGFDSKNKRFRLRDFLRRGVDALFDDFFSLRRASLFENEWIPSIDVQDRDGFITIKADMPGLSEKNIEVTLDKNVLIISGEKKDETNQDGKDQRYFVSERRFGSFRRAISLRTTLFRTRLRQNLKMEF